MERGKEHQQEEGEDGGETLGEGDTGDTVHSVNCKVCLSSDSQAAKELDHRTIH